MQDYTEIWQLKDSITTVVEANHYSIWELSQTDYGFILEMKDHINEDIIALLCGQFPIAADYDEGFGTLDPDALDSVIDSLAMLQSSQGKKVGVISHTNTMVERITTQIRIIKNGHSGSSHTEIYT